MHKIKTTKLLRMFFLSRAVIMARYTLGLSDHFLIRHARGLDPLVGNTTSFYAHVHLVATQPVRTVACNKNTSTLMPGIKVHI